MENYLEFAYHLIAKAILTKANEIMYKTLLRSNNIEIVIQYLTL